MSFELKYAPRQLSDVVHPSTAARAKVASIVSGNGKRSALFYGTYGTGKSVLCRLLAEHVWGLTNVPLVRVFDADAYDELGTDIAEAIKCEVSHQLTRTDVNITCPAIILDELDQCEHQPLITALYNKWQKENWQWYAATNHIKKIDSALASRLSAVHYDFESTDAFAPRVHQICANELGALPELDLPKIQALLKRIVNPNDPKLGWRRVLEAAAQIVDYKNGVITDFYLV